MQNENLFIAKNVQIVGKHFLQDIFYGITAAFQTNKNSLMKKLPTMVVLLLVFQIKVNL